MEVVRLNKHPVAAKGEQRPMIETADAENLLQMTWKLAARLLISRGWLLPPTSARPRDKLPRLETVEKPVRHGHRKLADTG